MAAATLSDPVAMASTSVQSAMTESFTDGSSQSYSLSYQPLFTTGDIVSNGQGGTVVAGGYFDASNKPILDKSVAGSERQFYSDAPDGMSLIQLANPTVTGLKGKAVFAVVQFEYTSRDNAGASAYGLLPSPISVLTLDQDPATGKLSLVKYHNVDTKKLSRILSCPAGAESTGLHAVDEVNGWTYLMSNLQHAGDWETPMHDKVKATLDPIVRANYRNLYGASVGYLTATASQPKLSKG